MEFNEKDILPENSGKPCITAKRNKDENAEIPSRTD